MAAGWGGVNRARLADELVAPGRRPLPRGEPHEASGAPASRIVSRGWSRGPGWC